MYSPPPLQHPRPKVAMSQMPSASPPPQVGNTLYAQQQSANPYQGFSSPYNAPPTSHDAYGPSYGYTAQPPQQNFYSQQYPQQRAVPQQAQQAQQSSQPTGQGWTQYQDSGANPFFPGVNEATAQMGMQIGKQAFDAGQKYIDRNVSRFLPTSHVKQSFNVSNGYVLNKLRIVLFPWRHKPWGRAVVRNETTGVVEGYKPPREDLNCPDLYIPSKCMMWMGVYITDTQFVFILMGFYYLPVYMLNWHFIPPRANVPWFSTAMGLTTYILLSAVIAGSQGAFDPSILGQTASKSFGLLILEFICIKLGCYLLGIGEEGAVTDLFAYEGYKFVGVIVTLFSGLMGAPRWLFWSIFLYTFFSNFFFMLRSLRHVILPDTSSYTPLDTNGASNSMSISHAQRNRRVLFLFSISLAQILSMVILVRV